MKAFDKTVTFNNGRNGNLQQELHNIVDNTDFEVVDTETTNDYNKIYREYRNKNGDVIIYKVIWTNPPEPIGFERLTYNPK